MRGSLVLGIIGGDCHEKPQVHDGSRVKVQVDVEAMQEEAKGEAVA
jgi:hypothetical protein